MKSFRRPDDLARHVRRHLDRFDLLTCDVFDTLLVRRVHDPDALKAATARFLARLAAAAGRTGWPVTRIQRLRDRVESLHRRRNGRTHPDREACYPKFMSDVLRVLLGRAEVADALAEVTHYELEIESRMLVARAEFVDLLMELKKAGKRVVAVSDMYLPAEHIRRLLDRAGFGSLLEGVYSSADTCRAKASGAAWPLLAERYGVGKDRWWHLGDHPISDGVRPAEFGLTALVLRDPREHFRKLVSRTYARMAVRRPYWRGRLAQQWMLPLEGENQPRSALFRLGYTFFGPLLCSFVHHVYERSRARGVGRVYFFSREGQILLDIWNEIVPFLSSGAPPIAAQYLYVSRVALASAAHAHEGLSHETARIAFLPAANRDFRDVARVFGLAIPPFFPLLARHGLAEDTVLSKWHDGWDPRHGDQFRRLVEDDDFQSEVRRQQLLANQALQHYLEEQGFFATPRVGVVDIGWLGTIQRFLHQSVKHREDRPVMEGFLLACATGYPFPRAPDNTLEGFFFDHQRFDFCGSLLLYTQVLFEESTRAHHGGLTGYRLRAEPPGYELTFRPESPAEQEQSSYFADVQAGIREAARRYGPALAVLGYEAREWKPWLNVLVTNHIAFPRASEMDVLTQRHHTDDMTVGKPGARARHALRRLWNRPRWQRYLVPFLRSYYFLKHAVWMLRQ